MNDVITLNGVKYRRVEEKAQTPKTGYEKVDDGELYYFSEVRGTLDYHRDVNDGIDESHYDMGNYYNDKTLAENNTRADTLMRRLRQWQALNDEPVDWSDIVNGKYCISFNYKAVDFVINCGSIRRNFNEIYFSTSGKANDALEVFHDELLWYFTEYQQRLDEPKRG